MTTSGGKPAPLQCPSAQPTEPDAVVFGIVTGSAESPRIGYLTEAQPVTEPLLALAGQARPGQVFRVAAPCMGSGCKHFDGSECRLVQRITAFLDPVVSGLPSCQIRPTCRWFRQEGREACIRCPQVVTEAHPETDEQRYVADPDNLSGPAELRETNASGS
jgi:hypothetical protein